MYFKKGYTDELTPVKKVWLYIFVFFILHVLLLFSDKQYKTVKEEECDCDKSLSQLCVTQVI